MHANRSLSAVVAALCLLASQLVFAQFVWDGSLELEHRYFFDTDASAFDARNTDRGQTSAKLELEFFRDWNDGQDTLTIEPFLRVDSLDDERTHGDLRQFYWSRLADNWELSAGFGRVFWGVTESQHLVDIINQTDLVENIDGEDKLGQPMIRYQYFHELGNLDAFILPYFRARTLPGIDSRLNGGLVVDPNREVYEATEEEKHVDFALRYNQTFGNWDVGLSVFDGTSREPDLLRLFDPVSFSTQAYYPQITQFGADIQLTTGAWLLKMEAIQRDFDDRSFEDFAATTVGAEYTLVGFLGSIYDLGLLAEYSWDERDERATLPFQNDAFLGARLALNDMHSSEVLLGVVQDLDFSGSRSVFIEGNTRLAASLTANIELRYFSADDQSDLLFGFRDDSFVQIGLQYYFD